MPFPFLKRKKTQKTQAGIDHLAVIMDGNGRWARKRGLPRNLGHKAGGETLRKVTEWCGNREIKYLTVYAFSTENWTRPSEEISSLMELLIEFLNQYEDEMEQQGIKLRVMGDLSNIDRNIREELDKAVKRSSHRKKMQLVIAFNYGGRREIVHAVGKIAKEVADGLIDPDDITEETLSSNMYLPDIPDPDLIIRPSGELRLSNFLMWQSAYSELWFSNVLWPDFKEADLDKAISDYKKRDRRFGGVKNED